MPYGPIGKDMGLIALTCSRWLNCVIKSKGILKTPSAAAIRQLTTDHSLKQRSRRKTGEPRGKLPENPAENKPENPEENKPENPEENKPENTEENKPENTEENKAENPEENYRRTRRKITGEPGGK